MRKPAFCICENKDADQLRGNREADQHLCFRYIDSTIPLLPKSYLLRLYNPVCVGPGRKPRRPVFTQRDPLCRSFSIYYIMITNLCNVDPLIPHFYIVQLGFTGVCIIFSFLLKNIDCEYSFEPPQ